MRERRGKESGQNEAVKRARGEILVFSDVATTLEKCGLTEIVANFADPQIGCVSSVDRLLTNGESQTGGEGLYVKYEMWLRTMESSVKSVVGLSGSFFAARKEVCFDFSTNMQSDFKTLLNSMKMGLRGISDPEAIGYYPDIKDKSREFDRKVRTVLRGLTVFSIIWNLLMFSGSDFSLICMFVINCCAGACLFLLIALFSGTCLIKTTETFKIIALFSLRSILWHLWD